MSTKEKLLKLLDSNRGVYFSGEDIAQELDVSRSAIWKCINALRSDGYCILAVTNKGYLLPENTDIITVQGIKEYLGEQTVAGTQYRASKSSNLADFNITVLPSTHSTNTILREKAAAGAPEGTVVIANEQTAGRGRLGRSFFSPAGSGIYMSLLLRPQGVAAEQAVMITTMAAVAMCEAIESISGKDASIKWVNDVFVDGKKVCGILTEGAFGLESGALEYAVLGLGVNVNPPGDGFPSELENIAGFVLDEPQKDAKNRLAAEFLIRFRTYYSDIEGYMQGVVGNVSKKVLPYVKEYQRRSFIVGKRVNIISAGGAKSDESKITFTKAATVLGIDDQCCLLVRYDNGKEECCSFGEVSIILPGTTSKSGDE